MPVESLDHLSLRIHIEIDKDISTKDSVKRALDGHGVIDEIDSHKSHHLLCFVTDTHLPCFLARALKHVSMQQILRDVRRALSRVDAGLGFVQDLSGDVGCQYFERPAFIRGEMLE